MVLRSTPLFLDVSGTKVRWNPIASIRITDFFNTYSRHETDSGVFSAAMLRLLYYEPDLCLS